MAPDPAPSGPPDAEPVPIAVARLRPTTRPGVLEGFVPLELVDRGPRILRPAADIPARLAERPLETDVPPVIVEPDVWAERDSLFGDL